MSVKVVVTELFNLDVLAVIGELALDAGFRFLDVLFYKLPSGDGRDVPKRRDSLNFGMLRVAKEYLRYPLGCFLGCSSSERELH